MTRKETMAACVKDHFKEHAAQALTDINHAFKTRYDEILSGFQKPLKSCAVQAEKMQRDSEKGPVESIVISVLISTVVTKTYELKIDFFDEKMYLDEHPASAYWAPEFMLPYLHMEDELTVRKLLNQKVTHITDYEMQEIEYGYVGMLMNVYPHLLKKMIKDSADLLSIADMEPEVDILYGNYMGQAFRIARLSLN